MTFNTLSELYDNSIEKFASKVANAMFERESVTFSEFDKRVKSLQDILLDAGLSSGDKVALLSTSMPNWSVCYFAVTTLGMIVVPILPGFSGPEFDMIIEHSESKALLISDKLFSKLSKTTIERQNIVIRTKNLGIISRRAGLARGVVSVPQPDDIASIIYTSGTTSKPKGVMLSHKALCLQTDMAYDIFPIDSDDCFLSILPMSHTYECSIGMLYPFSRGASVTYLDRPPTASVLIPAFRQIRPTIMLSVPLIIEKLFRSQVLAKFTSNAIWRWLYSKKWTRRKLHRIAGNKIYKVFGGRIRFFGIGGARLDSQTEQFLLDAKFPYAVGYGLTETAPLLAGMVWPKNRLQSTGWPMKHVQLRLDNVNPQTGEGEIVALTPSVMKGYFKNPEATAAAFTSDGWFRTNDLGCFDKDGYLYIKGRLNNMLVGPSGENIYPEEIENILNGLIFVSESVVTEEKGKLIALVKFNYEELEHKYYDLRDNLSAKMEEIKADVVKYVNSKVNSFSRISRVEEHTEEFEKTPTQKIKRFLYTKRNTSAH